MELAEQVCGWLGTSDIKPSPMNNGAETTEIKKVSKFKHLSGGIWVCCFFFFLITLPEPKNKRFQIPIKRHIEVFLYFRELARKRDEMIKEGRIWRNGEDLISQSFLHICWPPLTMQQTSACMFAISANCCYFCDVNTLIKTIFFH